MAYLFAISRHDSSWRKAVPLIKITTPMWCSAELKIVSYKPPKMATNICMLRCEWNHHILASLWQQHTPWCHLNADNLLHHQYSRWVHHFCYKPHRLGWEGLSSVGKAWSKTSNLIEIYQCKWDPMNSKWWFETGNIKFQVMHIKIWIEAAYVTDQFGRTCQIHVIQIHLDGIMTATVWCSSD